MQYGFSLIMRGNDATPETFAAMAEKAEATGADSLWCSEHIILPPQVKSGYVRVPGLKHPEHWKERYWEPIAVLGYLAARTSRVVLGTSVNILSMHHPIEWAKQVAELDQLTEGRFVYGVGVGWFEEEFDVLGWSFRNRGARTDEALEMMKVLWRDEPADFQGRYYSFENARFAPKPVQQPHPPIWIGGNSTAAMRRAARLADAWHPNKPGYEFLAEAKGELRRHLEEAGRRADALEIAPKLPLTFQDGPPSDGQLPTQGRPQDIIDAIRRYQELGATHFVFDFTPELIGTALETMERFANDVRPKL